MLECQVTTTTAIQSVRQIRQIRWYLSAMTVSSRSLDSLPYDVFYQIASTLECHDLVNLSRVNRNTYAMTLDESIARKTVQVC